MPKIGKHTAIISGQHRTFDIVYTRTEGFFLKDFPKEVWRVTGLQNSYATEGQLLDGVEKALYAYHDITKKAKKVIRYVITLPTEMTMNKVSHGSYVGTQNWLPKDFKFKKMPFGAYGHGFLIDYTTYVRVDAREAKYYNHNEQGDPIGGSVHPDREHYEIEWTEEREQFFISMQEQAMLMVQRMVKFLGQDPQLLLAAFDTGNVKLLNP